MGAVNCAKPSRLRVFDDKGNFRGFSGKYYEPDPSRVARGVIPVEYLKDERFRGCTEPAHVWDVLMAEGYYPRPEKYLDWQGEEVAGKEAVVDEWKKRYDKRRKAARERVKKRRSRA